MSRELLEVVAVCESHAARDPWLGPFTCVMDIYSDNLAPCLGISESHPGDVISILVSETALALSVSTPRSPAEPCPCLRFALTLSAPPLFAPSQVEHEHQSNAGSTKVVSTSSAHVHCVPGVSIVGGLIVSRAILMYLPLVRPLPTCVASPSLLSASLTRSLTHSLTHSLTRYWQASVSRPPTRDLDDSILRRIGLPLMGASQDARPHVQPRCVCLHAILSLPLA